MSRARPNPRVLAAVGAAIALVAAAAIWWHLRPIRWLDGRRPPPPLAAAIDQLGRGDLDAGLASVDRALRRYRMPRWESGARVLAAWHLDSAGRATLIGRYLRGAGDPNDPLFAHRELLRARGLLAHARPGDAVEAAGAAARVSGFPERDEAIRVEAMGLAAAGRAGDAIDLLEKETSTTLRLEAARVAATAGDRREARRRLAAILLDAESGDDAERALAELTEIEPDATKRLEPSERMGLARAADRWRDAGRPAAALDLLRAMRPVATTVRSISPEEALVEADLLLRLGRTGEGAPLLARASEGAPEVRDGADYLRARVALARGRTSAWRMGLESLARRRSTSEWRLAALLDLARASEGAPSGATLAAYRRYREAAGPRADPTALWRETWAAYETSRWREFDAGVDRILGLRDAPDGVRSAALYWRGRRLAASGRTAEARSLWSEVATTFVSTYYAVAASRRLGRPTPTASTTRPPDLGPEAAGAGSRWLEAARLLRAVGLREPSAGCYRAAIAASPEAARRVALEAADAALGDASPSEALRFVAAAFGDKERIRPGDLPVRYWQLLVPAPSGQLLARVAGASGLDPVLVASVVLEESAFNPLAVSRAGARGLLQLMPSTGAEIARRIGMVGFDEERLFEPETNLRLGCAQLSFLLEKYRSLPAALVGYNAGAARVERWLDAATRHDEDRFVERIPFGETRIYVKRILTNTYLYRVAWPDGIDHPVR